jgi:hypothetical protein
MNELPTLGETIRQALRLSPEIFSTIQTSPQGLGVALTIVLLAAFSESLGQSVVLFLNRVRPKRFMLTLAISTISNMVGYCLWSATVWTVVQYIFDRPIAPLVVAKITGLAYAPQLLAFFELMPFLGNSFGLLLSLWSMAAIVIAIYAGADLLVWQAAVASGLGWVMIQVFRRSLGAPIYALGRLAQRHAAGVPLEITIKDVSQARLPHTSQQNWHKWLSARRRVVDDQLQQFRQKSIERRKRQPEK